MAVELWSKNAVTEDGGAPVTLSDGTLLTNISISGAGNQEVFYSQNGGSTWASTSWDYGATTFRPDTAVDYEPVLQMVDPADNIFTVGRDYSPTTGVLIQRHTWDDINKDFDFQDEYAYDTGGTIDSQHPRATMFSLGGDIYIPLLYRVGTNGYWELRVFRRTSGGTWSLYQNLGTVVATSYQRASITFRHNGDGVTPLYGNPELFVYLTNSTAGHLTRYSYSGGTWTAQTPKTITAGYVPQGGNVVYDAFSDKVLVAYAGASNTNIGHAEVNGDLSGSWTYRTTNATWTNAPMNPQLFVDGASNVYTFFAGSSVTIRYVKRPPGGPFDAPVTVYDGETLSAYGNEYVLHFPRGVSADAPTTMKLIYNSNWSVWYETYTVAPPPVFAQNDGFGSVTI